jgi:hypothetical protein
MFADVLITANEGHYVSGDDYDRFAEIVLDELWDAGFLLTARNRAGQSEDTVSPEGQS